MPGDAGAQRTTPDVVGEKRLRLKEKEEYFCCVGLRERHNSLCSIDGPVESRKFVTEVGGHSDRKAYGGQDGGTEMTDDLQFTVQRPPAYGELTDVLPGLFWVRLPVPTAPNHVNCWLLDNGPGWTLVDCGLNTDDTFEIWDKLWRGLLRSRPLQNLTFTHAHLDHFGLASYFVKEMKCAVRLPLAEWLNAWKMWHEREEGPDEHFAAFMKRNGASDDDAAQIMGAQRRSTYLGLRPPREFIRIRDGDLIAMGQREWRVMSAGGHSVEHALFYCESDRILIAGDQVLSHMTPSVITPSAQPEANPMKEYLDSLARLETLPSDTLVLPSHGLPFRGFHDRLAQLREHHLARLDDVASVITGRTSAFAVAQEVFPRVLYANPRQAFGESLAHLNMLASLGRLTRDVDAAGAISFAPA
jgi:glyoxylase-like metal-dependent hydrolase (beta-lactamase superfamily II)